MKITFPMLQEVMIRHPTALFILLGYLQGNVRKASKIYSQQTNMCNINTI